MRSSCKRPYWRLVPVFLSVFVAFFLGLVASAGVVRAEAGPVYVDAHAPGPTHDGLSWTTAFTEVQSVLVGVAPGTEIWVAQGVYKPDFDPGSGGYTGYMTATFVLTDGVKLYGGFASGADALSSRAPQLYVTVLSGDLDGNDATDANGIVTDTVNITGTTAYHVVTSVGVDATAVIDGFTITAGRAPGSSHNHGGGMLNVTSSPKVVHVHFIGNVASFGGGGMANRDGSAPELLGVVFSNNVANGGGGMLNRDDSNPTLTNVVFRGNVATYFGGGMNNDQSLPTLINVLFSGNHAGFAGGGLENYQSHLRLVNVTFNGNVAAQEGGGVYNDTSTLIIENSILWGNRDSTGVETAGAQIGSTSSTTVISYTLVQASGGSGAGWNGALGTDGGGNLDVDPEFITPVDPDDAPTTAGNLRLTSGSPAIDAGDDAAVSIAIDLDGNPRIAAPRVDMGAYEAAAVCFATIDGVTVYSSTTAMAVQQAVDAAGVGQTVKVAGYCSGVQLRTALSQTVYIDKRLTLQGGYTFTNWTVPVSMPTTLDALGQGRVVRVQGADDVVLENVRMVNGYAADVGSQGGGGVQVVDATVTISGCAVISSLAANGGGVAYLGDSSGRVVNTLFARNTATSKGAALYLDMSGRVTILYTTIASPTLGTPAAIYVGAGTASITNTIVASYTLGIVRAGMGSVTEDYNLFSDVITAGNIAFGMHSLRGDARFADPAHDDYHLTVGSDAIDEGEDVGVVVDFEGDVRPLDGGFDIGYDEYVLSPFNIYLPLVLRN